MRSRVSWPPHVWIWSAGILMCLLGASGVAVMVRATSPAYAGNAPDASPAVEASSAMPQSPAPLAKATTMRTNCTECGTIASIREVASAADSARRDLSEARRDHGMAIASSPRAASAADAEGTLYEITIRFRDGRTSVFTEPGPPTWRVGNRIVFIDGTTPKAN